MDESKKEALEEETPATAEEAEDDGFNDLAGDDEEGAKGDGEQTGDSLADSTDEEEGEVTV